MYKLNWNIHLYYINPCIADEWKNFLERFDREEGLKGNETSEEKLLKGNEKLDENVRLWASYRGQTLTRTGTTLTFLRISFFIIMKIVYYSDDFHYDFDKQVRGMMYYRQALELQAFLDMASDEGTYRNHGGSLFSPHDTCSLIKQFLILDFS